MLYLRKMGLGLLVGLMAMQTGAVQAQDGEVGDVEVSEGAPDGYPSRYADRPLTLDPMMLAASLSVSIADLGLDTGISSNLGIGFGIIDNLEVRAQLAPLSISPAFDYGDPALAVTYRILDGDFELGARVSAAIPISGADFGLNVDVPMLVHMDALRIDTGLNFSLGFGDSTVIGMGVPIQAVYNVTDDFGVGLLTGFNVGSFDAFGDSWTVPLGLLVGYTLAGDSGPTGDIYATFGMPFFLSAAGDGVTVDFWQATVGYEHFLSL